MTLPTARRCNRNYTFAYQPLVDMANRTIVSYEALIRGANNEPAFTVLEGLPSNTLDAFDEEARLIAIELAAALGLACNINLNFRPAGLEGSGKAIASAVAAASSCGVAPNQLVIEITEDEIISDIARLTENLNEFRTLGVQIAIDDFGAGFAGLSLLAAFQPDTIKLDMKLIRGIESRGPQQAIVRGVFRTCFDLGIEIIAEGVETLEEFRWLRHEGVNLFQGYLFAKLAFETLPPAYYPE